MAEAAAAAYMDAHNSGASVDAEAAARRAVLVAAGRVTGRWRTLALGLAQRHDTADAVVQVAWHNARVRQALARRRRGCPGRVARRARAPQHEAWTTAAARQVEAHARAVPRCLGDRGGGAPAPGARARRARPPGCGRPLSAARQRLPRARPAPGAWMLAAAASWRCARPSASARHRLMTRPVATRAARRAAASPSTHAREFRSLRYAAAAASATRRRRTPARE